MTGSVNLYRIVVTNKYIDKTRSLKVRAKNMVSAITKVQRKFPRFDYNEVTVATLIQRRVEKGKL